MKKLILLFSILLSVTTIQAQQYLTKPEKEIKSLMEETHKNNITGYGEFNLQYGKSLIYEVYIPITKEYVTLVYNLNRNGKCFQYLRLADIKNYDSVKEYLTITCNQIDDTHYTDDNRVKWTLHKIDDSDFFTLMAEN